MLPIIIGQIEEQVWAFCQRWLDNLARGYVTEIDRPNDFGILWNAKKISEVVTVYLGPEVTPVISSKPIKECYPLIFLRDDNGINLEFNLPLNGKISDLTVQFEFNKLDDKFEIVLHDISVL